MKTTNLYYLPLYLSLVQWQFFLGSELSISKIARRLLNQNVSEEASMRTNDFIKRYGYPVETHEVETQDGYILTLFRISAATLKNKGVVFLQHGYFSTSDAWLLLKNNSLPYVLTNKGYDVWLGNTRCTKYSYHKNIAREDPEYWEYSFHEIGRFDVPAMINHVIKVAGENQLTWIGHSMGTTMYFVAMDLHPELQKFVKNVVLLAPIAYSCNMQSPVKYLAFLSTQQLENLYKFLSLVKTFPLWLTSIINGFGPRICTGQFATLCGSFYGFVGGSNWAQFDEETIQKAIAHIPSDSSVKSGFHYLQGIGEACEFRRYDFGRNENFKIYGQQKPPIYNLTSINVPTLAMYGDGDIVSHPKDVWQTVLDLQNVQMFTKIPDPFWSHFDFIFAKDAPRLVYKEILDFIS